MNLYSWVEAQSSEFIEETELLVELVQELIDESVFKDATYSEFDFSRHFTQRVLLTEKEKVEADKLTNQLCFKYDTTWTVFFISEDPVRVNVLCTGFTIKQVEQVIKGYISTLTLLPLDSNEKVWELKEKYDMKKVMGNTDFVSLIDLCNDIDSVLDDNGTRI